MGLRAGSVWARILQDEDLYQSNISVRDPSGGSDDSSHSKIQVIPDSELAMQVACGRNEFVISVKYKEGSKVENKAGH